MDAASTDAYVDGLVTRTMGAAAGGVFSLARMLWLSSLCTLVTLK